MPSRPRYNDPRRTDQTVANPRGSRETDQTGPRGGYPVDPRAPIPAPNPRRPGPLAPPPPGRGDRAEPPPGRGNGGGRVSYNSAAGIEPSVYRGVEADPAIDPESYLPTDMAYADTPQATPASTPTQYQPYTANGIGGTSITSGNAEDMALQDRMWAYDRGNSLDQQLTDNVNYESGLRNNYRTSADQAYDPLLHGQGGYTPQEQTDIMGRDGLNALQLTDDQANQNYLTGDEQSAIQGDPSFAERWFSPQMNETIQHEGDSFQRGAYGNLQSGLNAAVDPSRLRTRDGFQDDLNNAVGGAEAKSDEALSSPGMEVSDQFLQDYKMSPEEQQDIVTSAGISAGNRIRGAADELSRKSRAAGMNPMGVAAMRGRMERQAGGEAADANTRARVQASEAAAGRLENAENMRVRYGQSAAGMRSDAARNFGAMNLDAQSTGEQMRLGAEQGASDRLSRAAQVGGEAALNTEGRLADNAKDTRRYIETTGINLARGTDDRNTSRAATIAQNRQGVSQGNQNERFKRGSYINDQTSNRATNVAGARRADEQEARGYVRDQYKTSTNNEQGGLDRRVNLYNSQSNNAQRATQNRSVAEGTPGKGERIFGGIMQAAAGAAGGFAGGGKEKGGVITKPTYVLVGEAGPEAIVPIGLEDDDADVLPSMALTASQPGSFDTAPPPMRGAAAYGQKYRYAR